jgi:Holliday junction resolvasome RuvABC DNA-binding subunit
MACVCGAHHTALHEGKVIAAGRASTGFSFRHADGTRYGGAVSPKAAHTSTAVFQALKHMGFRESEARRAVDSVATHVGETTIEAMLRRALVELAPAPSG